MIPYRLHVDGPLLAALLLLGLVGLFTLYSASGQDSNLVFGQAQRLALGFVLALVIAQTPGQFWQQVSPWLFAVGLGLLLAVALVGEASKGATRWLNLGILRFQPSEIMKLALPLMLAWLYAQVAAPPRLVWIVVGLGVLAVPSLLIAKQPDLGTALLVAAAGGISLYLAGLSYRYILGLLLAVGAVLPVVWLNMLPYQRMRVYTFLSPESDPMGAGWNTIQAKIAIGSGGLYGKGWLHGSQTQLEFIPERHTDFIFAVLSEEWGLVSVGMLLALYLFIVLRGLVLASYAPTRYGQILAGTLSLIFFVYVFINIGMVSGILPVVGVPLPLISYGGTSLVTLLVGFGILMAVTRPAPRRLDFN